MKNNQTKCSITAIVGRPNAGKSTFLNYVIGQKISIISPKIQTTRTLIRGIFTEGDFQSIFVDTPGIFEPKRKLEKSIVKTAWVGLEEGIDFVIHLFDGKKGITPEDQLIMQSLQKKTDLIHLAVINKIDALSEQKIFTLAKEIFETNIYKDVFMISATKGKNIEKLLLYLREHSTDGPWLYPVDEVTTLPSKLLASEITREKLFMLLEQELPYNLTVETENWEEREDSIKINQVIYVNKDSYKKIILGKKGELIKEIGTRARKELAEIFDKTVHLFLFVKVREDWIDNPEIYNYMGMQLPK